MFNFKSWGLGEVGKAFHCWAGFEIGCNRKELIKLSLKAWKHKVDSRYTSFYFGFIFIKFVYNIHYMLKRDVLINSNLFFPIDCDDSMKVMFVWLYFSCYRLAFSEFGYLNS